MVRIKTRQGQVGTCIVSGYPQVQKLNIDCETPMGHGIDLPYKVITGSEKMLLHCHPQDKDNKYDIHQHSEEPITAAGRLAREIKRETDSRFGMVKTPSGC